MSDAIGLNHPTLYDLAQATGPDGMPLRLVEYLQMRTPLLQFLAWRQGNTSTGHQIARGTSLPSGNWKKINQGIRTSKGTQDKVTETCGMLADKSEIDEDLVELNGGLEYRAKQDMRKVIGLKNQLETAFFYESTKTNVERISGLSPRLDSKSGEWGKQIIDMSDYGMAQDGSDKSSIWVMTSADDKLYGIVPMGTQAGLRHTDKGNIMVPDENGDTFPAWVSVFKWRVGLCVEDARYLVRIANIDMSQISRSGKAIVEALISAVHRLQGKGEGGRSAIFMHRLVSEYLHQQGISSSINSTFNQANPGGTMNTSFLGLPIYESDALLLTESQVT